MTGENYRRAGAGKDKKYRENAAKQPLIILFSFSGMTGFFALWV